MTFIQQILIKRLAPGPMLGARNTTVNKTKQIRSMALWSLYSQFDFNQQDEKVREILFTI